MANPQEDSGLDADEPRTPFWLTLLGGALFVLGAVFLLATCDDEPGPAADDAAAAEVQGSATED